MSVQLDVEQAKLLRATLNAFIHDGDGGIADAERRIAEQVLQAVRVETAHAYFDENGLCVPMSGSDTRDFHDTFINKAKSEALLLMLHRSRLGYVEPAREDT